ncbi:hypothetical protein, partial [Klebsiella pneumoniae]|uniref:hypothetical protein n=1 Tax=Klebsiella pneumoniae TaxID=573 RepID=UPI003EE05379
QVASELYSLARGTTILRHRDEHGLGAIVVAAAHIAGMQVDAAPYALLADTERRVAKAIARRTKKAMEPVLAEAVRHVGEIGLWSKRAL